MRSVLFNLNGHSGLSAGRIRRHVVAVPTSWSVPLDHRQGDQAAPKARQEGLFCGQDGVLPLTESGLRL